MKYDTLLSFLQSLNSSLPSVALLQVKEEGERRRALEAILKILSTPTIFSPDSFSSQAFLQEVETVPFLVKHKILIIKEIDQLKSEDLKVLEAYIEHPNSWISLFFTAAAVSPKFVKAIEKQGSHLLLKEEKPWEKEKRLSDWLMHVAAESGVALSSQAAQMLLKSVASDQLSQELEKLICYVGERKKIGVEDIKAVCCAVSHETLWQLGDAIFQFQTARSQEIAKELLEEESSFFPMIANLKGQFQTSLKILTTFQEKGKEGIAQAFPYLKGALLDKKLKICQSYGRERFEKGLLELFETELKAKNSSVNPELLLELLLAKL